MKSNPYELSDKQSDKKAMANEYFTWNEVYNTGIVTIDTQHKVILKILNELYDVVFINKKDDKLAGILHELVQYTIYHFEEEEKLFEKYHFIAEKEHKKEHALFVEQISAFKQKLNTNDRLITLELIDFLKNWLIDHILVKDQEYVKFFNAKGIQIN